MNLFSQFQQSKHRGLIILALDLILFFILIHTLPFSPSENKGLALLVFAGVLWLTEAFNITVTALMIPILAIGMGLLKTKDAFATFSEPIIFMFFGGFVLAAVLQIQGLDKVLAHFIIKLAKGNLKKTVFYLFFATAFISMWMNNTAVAAMMLPLTIGILSGVNIAEDRRTYSFVLMGIAFSANIGGIGTLVGSAPNGILASQLDITFAEWLKFGMPVMLLLLPSMLLSLWVVLRPNLNAKFDFKVDAIKLTPQNKTTLIIFFTTVLLLCFGSIINPIISGVLGLDGKIASFDSVVVMVAVIALIVAGTATWTQIQERVEWGILMLFGGGLTLSVVLKDSGASQIMADTIVHLVSSQHWLVITLALTAFIVFLTEFTSNTASAALLMPIFIAVAQSLGIEPIALAAIIACGASCAFMLPIATPPNAIVFATGHIKFKEMVRVGLLLNICSVLIIGGLAYFFWK
ncbi:DASS family sodium-coupled anion symporter [Moraxella sp. FZLJ2107]|uniref:SLC13 family permease n=1 Tax=unclassified Moraxella TaxID=2685852 RepID=UPI0020C88EA1|nr:MULTISPECIES: DASS family sodium-coupled anion symporter [unclassified Moraxella]UTO05199.1 DASS family sodium-coupled anion symporter [Moraxella sp. FZLJ2107]UTO21934.1 DASS family sodium-coupled anion symporter [Moraxella sp. FZLJ2109]